MPWEDLTQAVTSSEVGEKDGPAVIPARFAPCPDGRCNRNGGLDCGGGRLHRLGANVEVMTGFGADLDDISDVRLAQLLEDVRAAGLACWWWTTYSHEGGEHCRARILLPFAEELPLANPRWWSRVAWPALVSVLGLEGAATADSACRDPARIYYLPRRPDAGAWRPAGFIDGAPLDWRAVLGDALEQGAVAAGDFIPAGEPDESRPVDLDSLRARMGEVRTGAAQYLKRVLRGEAPQLPPERRAPGEASRYQAWRAVTGALAAVAEDWESSRGLLAVLEPAYLAEVGDSPSDFTEWETVEHLLDAARAGMPAYRAQLAAERAAQLELYRGLLRGRTTTEPDDDPPPPPPPPPAPRGGAPPPTPLPAPPRPRAEVDWTAGLEYVQRGDEVAIKAIPANLSAILQHHPQWRGALRYNLLAKRVEYRGEAMADHHVAEISDTLSRELHVVFADQVVRSRAEWVAHQDSFDPIAEYLHGLKWDGVPRVRRWLIDYFGAKADGQGVAAYLEAVGMRWMVSAVARGLDPGCKVDTVLELLSPTQGKNKSQAVGILGGAWASETPIEIGSKSAYMTCATTWIVELGELETYRKADVEQQRNFLSNREDTFLPPYGHYLVKSKRHCVFLGTGNGEDYLRDPAGNRRHWPVTIGEGDLEALRRDRDQLWAEATALYLAGEQWHLTPEEEVLAARETDARETDDAIAEKIAEWFERLTPDKRPREVTTRQVCEEVLGESVARGLETRIGVALRRLKFHRYRNNREGARCTRYVVPDSLLSATKREIVSPLVVLPGGR